MTNSSPERRASVSPGRMRPAIRSATATRRSSPTRWPWLSLTDLKRSRSTKRIATGWPRRPLRSRACSSRSSRRRRFGRPVSASWRELVWNCSDASCSSDRALALARYAAVTSASVWAASMSPGVSGPGCIAVEIECAELAVLVAQREGEHRGEAGLEGPRRELLEHGRCRGGRARRRLPRIRRRAGRGPHRFRSAAARTATPHRPRRPRRTGTSSERSG